MNFGLFLLVSSLAVFLVSAAISFTKRQNYRLQLYSLVAMAFSNGVFIAILGSYNKLSLMIWPAIFLIRIITLAVEVSKKVVVSE